MRPVDRGRTEVNPEDTWFLKILTIKFITFVSYARKDCVLTEGVVRSKVAVAERPCGSYGPDIRNKLMKIFFCVFFSFVEIFGRITRRNPRSLG